MTFCDKPPTQIFNHSEITNLKLKNIDIFPSGFTTTTSQGVELYWSNINFQPIGDAGKRVWQLQGSGYANQNMIEINYITLTPYTIGFEGVVSGVITSSTFQQSLNASDYTIMNHSSENNSTIIKMVILTEAPLLEFGYSIFINDSEEMQDKCTNIQCPGPIPAINSDSLQTLNTEMPLTALPLVVKGYSSTPKKNLVFTEFIPETGQTIGSQPWINTDQTSFDLITKLTKYTINSLYSFIASLSIEETTTNYIFTTNLVPTGCLGDFPIQCDNPLYAYDTNPKNIVEWPDSKLKIPKITSSTDGPHPVGMGMIGLTFTNLALFGPLNENGSDPLCFEIQDNLCAHPQQNCYYHCHPICPSLYNYTVTTEPTPVAIMMDGNVLIAPYLNPATNKVYTNEELDVCHGLTFDQTYTFALKINGSSTTITYNYAYVINNEFPYYIGAFKNKPTGTIKYSSTNKNCCKMRPPCDNS